MAQIPYIPMAYQGRSVTQDSQRLVNFYPELDGRKKDRTVALFGIPGQRLFTSTSSSVRGWVSFQDLVYAVIGNTLISIDKTGNIIAPLGTLNTSDGLVSMKTNGLASEGIGGNQIMIVDGVNGYIFNVVTRIFQQITSYSAVQATATLNLTSSAINSVTLTSAGSGYDNTVTASISDPTGAGAAISLRIGYRIASISITGFSQVSGPGVAVTITDPTGTGATAVPVFTSSGGKLYVTGVTVTAAGSGYTNPVVTISSLFLNVYPVAHVASVIDIMGIDVLAHGNGYTSPTVVFAGGGSGTGATATAVINRSISSVTVTAGGSGYITPPLVTISGDGAPSFVPTIIAPFTPATGSVSGSGTAIAVTYVGHGLVTGDTINAAGASPSGYNASGVAVTVTGVNTFTYPATGTGAVSTAPTITLVSSHLSGNGTTATVKYKSHGLLTGNTITVSGSSISSYNTASATVTVIDADTFTYPSGGTGTPTTMPTMQPSGVVAAATATVVNTSVTAITITSGGGGYTGVPTISIAAPIGTFFPDNPKQVEYIDGYFVVSNGTMNVYASELFDGTLYNPLATAVVYSSSDNVELPINFNDNMTFITESSVLLFYNTGTPTSQGFPYSPMIGSSGSYGTQAPASVVNSQNGLIFLGWDDGSFVGVMMQVGTTANVVSPPQVTWRLSQSPDITKSFAYCYSEEGHSFYVLTDPAGNQTWAYDLSTGLWAERSSGSGSGINRQRIGAYVQAFGMHLVSDYQTGNVYEMSSMFYTEGGNPLTGIQRTSHVREPNRPDIFIGELQAHIESGVGMDSTSNPATATATIVGGVVTGISLVSGGADYPNLVNCFTNVTMNDGTDIEYNGGQPLLVPLLPAKVIFESVDGNGSGATASATVTNGSVSGITVLSGGSGYTTPPRVLIVSPPIVPFAALSISNDSGHTWGNEYPRSMGNVGEYRQRLRWYPIGKSRDRVFQLRISSPCKRILLGYTAEAS